MTALAHDLSRSLPRRGLPLIAVLLALFVSGCGVNNIPTLEEQAKATWATCRTSTSAAPT